MKIKRAFWQAEDAPISCRQLGPVLQAYLDNEVDPSEIDVIEAHLEACKDCGLEAETYTAIKQSLGQHRGAIPEDALARLRAFSEDLSNQLDDGPE